MAPSKSNGRSADKSSTTPDALSLLKADHKAVKGLFADYAKLCADDEADTQDKEALATRICLELTVHAQIEEEIFYPALREALEDQDILDEAEVEHASAKDLITQLQEMGADDELYDAKVTVLGEYIDHHVEEEEGEMFKQVKKAKVDVEELGDKLKARQEELKAEWGLEDEPDASANAKSDDENPPPRRGSRRGSNDRRAA